MPVDHDCSVHVVRVGQRAAHERVQEARAQVKAAHAAVTAVGDQQRVCVRLTDRLRKIEARVGGIAVNKGGVNGAGENLVGAFHQPRLVVADIDPVAEYDEKLHNARALRRAAEEAWRFG